MVKMCSFLVSLIWSIIEARVVDLPEPVGPVTRINPLGFSVIFLTIGGNPKVSKDGTSVLIVLNAAAYVPLFL